MNRKINKKRGLRGLVKTAVLFFCIIFCSGQYLWAGDLRSYLGGLSDLKNSAEFKVKSAVGGIVGKYAGPTAGNIVKTGEWTHGLTTFQGAKTAGKIISGTAIGMGAAAAHRVPSVGTIGKAIYGISPRETISASLRGVNNYARPILNNYVKPVLYGGLNIFFGKPAGASENGPVNESLVSGSLNNSSNGRMPSATYDLLKNSSVVQQEIQKSATLSVQAPSTAVTLITPEVLIQQNPASLNKSVNLMGPYRNNGRRESDLDIYNPKFDILITPDDPAGSNTPNVLNQINPASVTKEKKALYYNDGTQYGFRSNRNDKYDIRINLNDFPVDPNASSQINQASLNSPMGLYYNDGTQYWDRSITNYRYKIIELQNKMADASK